MPETNFNDLMEGLKRHAEQELERGIALGRQMERAALLAYLDGGAKSISPVAASPEAGVETKTKKAPKGLAAQIIGEILTAHPGMSLPELEADALARDARIAKKSVYNHLNAQRATLYLNKDGCWYLRSQIPQVSAASEPAPSEVVQIDPRPADARLSAPMPRAVDWTALTPRQKWPTT